MNFQGFQHSYPLLLIILAGLLLVLISWYSYQQKKHIPTTYRYLLIALRSALFLLLLLLVLNPFFLRSTTVEERNTIMFLLDDSESTTLQKGSYKGQETYRQILQNLEDHPVKNDLNSEYYRFSAQTYPVREIENLSLDGSETNLDQAFSQIVQLEDELDAVVLVSDGIITYGKNPLIEASGLTIPIFTIGLGDTTEVRDLVVQSVESPSSGFTESDHPVSVSVAQNGYEGSEVELHLRDASGNIISSKTIDFSTDRSVLTIDMEIQLDKAGLQQYSVSIPALDSEWSADNNVSYFSVNVSESRFRILDIAFELHPDVRMMRSILSTDPNVELTTLTRSSTGFVETEQPDYGNTDLVILHGISGTGQDQSILNAIDDIPSLYLRKPLSYRSFGEDFILNRSRSGDVFQIGFVPNMDQKDHPILETDEVSYSSLPPLYSTLDTRMSIPDGRILLNGTFEDIPGNQSILTITERGNLRRAELSAWGWYRIFQSPIETERNYAISLMNNIISWVSSDPNENRLKIAPRKPVFDPNDTVLLDATLRNESGDSESGAVIEVQVTGSTGTERTFSMESTGQGSYALEVDNLGSGRYEYTATARKSGRQIDQQSGEFLVNTSNTEFIYTSRNDEILNAIAQETGGQYLTYDRSNELWVLLKQKGYTDIKEVVAENYFYPVRSVWWFVIILIMLSAEWFIRKRFSLP